ncbi:hypothetical protein D9756_008197 [Leucocoprinus leucothites]|uniref:BZIP domain-containing protein n=1 Tax=Leucocoprinus leucothites TaxID=201217 RepID=A0A8H5FVZ4_9AGAR|nr:hypothetical protein D9756_008197 [Leucoagaricus leucothites]
MMLADSALDIDQFLNTDLFQSLSPPSPASTPSSPEQGLLTPPQQAPAPSFHDAASDGGAQPPFSLFDDEIKAIDALGSSNPFDYLGGAGAGSSLMSGFSGLPMDLGYSGIPGFNMNMNMNMNMGFGMPMDDALQAMAIDPQLVDTPATAPISDFDDHDQDGDDEQSNSTSNSPVTAPSPSGSTSTSTSSAAADKERLTLTIAPIKVGGHGKARRGTVQSGGIAKKSAVGTMSALHHHAHTTAVLPPPPTHTSPSPAPSFASSSSTPTTATPDNGKAKPLPKPPAILKASASKKGKTKDKEFIDDEDEDDVPQDWRPSPEVFAKMTSKEKRQLRNKISARNFRVRRKEYISTLEGDIAERDRLLEAVRSELGSTQSENLALRQEIEALKKVLLEGRSGSTDLPSLNLPPPAPLPVGLGAITAATAVGISSSVTPVSSSGEGMVPSPPGTPAPSTGGNAIVSTSAPLSAPTPTPAAFTPNIQKDLPSSPTPGRPFWGGQHHSSLGGIGGGGVTPVHTTLIPEINVSLWGSVAGNGTNNTAGNNGVERGGKNTNINPLLNAIGAGVTGKTRLVSGVGVEREKENKPAAMMSGFDAFADANLFTMKSLDAYRMQLWGKMAAQHHAHGHLLAQQQQQQAAHQHQQQQQLTGPAAQMRPAYFSSPSLSPKAIGSSSTGLGSTLSALLSGKHSSSATGLLTPPASPRLGARGSNTGTVTKERESQKEREAQAAMLAAVASQTLFKKLGNAFWDAFSGSSSSSSSVQAHTTASPSTASPSTSANAGRSWDAEKVRKVLEGRAVVRVVDVDPFTNTPIVPPALGAASTASAGGANAATKCCASVSDILEESMRSLTLSHKGAAGSSSASASASSK